MNILHTPFILQKMLFSHPKGHNYFLCSSMILLIKNHWLNKSDYIVENIWRDECTWKEWNMREEHYRTFNIENRSEVPNFWKKYTELIPKKRINSIRSDPILFFYFSNFMPTPSSHTLEFISQPQELALTLTLTNWL